MVEGKKKVLIVQTGSVEYVEDAYYERYKDEGILLIPEEDEEITEAPLSDSLPKVPKEVPKVELKEVPKVELKEVPKVELKEVPKVVSRRKKKV